MLIQGVTSAHHRPSLVVRTDHNMERLTERIRADLALNASAPPSGDMRALGATCESRCRERGASAEDPMPD